MATKVAFITSLVTQVPYKSPQCSCRQNGINYPRQMQTHTSPHHLTMFRTRQPRHNINISRKHYLRWRAMLGGGGFLGVGAPEVVVTVAIGWILLGPKKLYELARDMGKLVGQVRRMATEAQGTFQDALAMDLEEAEAKERGEAVEAKGDDDESETVVGREEEVMDESQVDDIIEKTAQALERDADFSEGEGVKKYSSSKHAMDDSEADGVAMERDGVARANGRVKEQNEIASRRTFLDQLTRVQDPHQAPRENGAGPDRSVPDLDVSEEMELAELERQHQEAKRRLLEKHRSKQLRNSLSNQPTSSETSNSNKA
eukprot:Plantae.Rhodophyta-Hildenbrandia_rubra.ctg15381.p1 GENE.Plantae.Rhodophyta-Hildenbrandia_rubra.ctg15381~~Plantae.Rhodophyta-Hildenbrandia_rubra.ctg15381.p1  ORF type:complete len:338 (+),score=73.28 Plantae.Rhodophyta-Hildenbrandia_rubra.ctg15381:72-1016(+)